MKQKRKEIKETIEGTGKYIECDWETFFNDIEYSCFCIQISYYGYIYFKEVRK